MMEPKQVIVVRRDLNMPPGKLAAQVAHASMAAVLSEGEFVEHRDAKGALLKRDFVIGVQHRPSLDHWLSGSFTKVCLMVHSEQELMEIYDRARALMLPCSLIEDSGRTVFHGIVTRTCIAIGPLIPEAFRGLTDHLKLYR
jgi:peptidyl-tRNA hydrolase, PTH2 family